MGRGRERLSCTAVPIGMGDGNEKSNQMSNPCDICELFHLGFSLGRKKDASVMSAVMNDMNIIVCI